MGAFSACECIQISTASANLTLIGLCLLWVVLASLVWLALRRRTHLILRSLLAVSVLAVLVGPVLAVTDVDAAGLGNCGSSAIHAYSIRLFDSQDDPCYHAARNRLHLAEGLEILGDGLAAVVLFVSVARRQHDQDLTNQTLGR